MVATPIETSSAARASAVSEILPTFGFQTCTINYGADLPLARGVQFDIGES